MIIPSLRKASSLRHKRFISTKFNNSLPQKVKIFEVGARDGLQNEKNFIATDVKIKLINDLSETGLKFIEVTSFVSPKRIPQLADNYEVFKGISRKKDIAYTALVPNLLGLERALEVGLKEVAVFVSASESFSQNNIHCSIERSFERSSQVIEKSLSLGLNVRGYVSCVIGCPYEGRIKPQKTAEVAERLHKLGCYEISLGDTIGVGAVGDTQRMLEEVMQKVPQEKIAVHFHNTYGQAIANIYASLQMGVSTVDSSVSGLGGCPFAKYATGNVATEDVLYMLNSLGIQTGVDIEKVIKIGNEISKALKKSNQSAVARALMAKDVSNNDNTEESCSRTCA